MIFSKLLVRQSHSLITRTAFNFRPTANLNAPQKDFYKLLGVPRDSTQEELKKAYYKLVHKCHPDKNPNDVEGSKQKLAEINAAYDTLKDENKRKAYDMTGMSGDEQQQAGGNPFAGGWGGQGGASAEDIFGEFESFFNMGMGGGAERVQKGQDIFVNVDLSFMESVAGMSKKIQIEKKGVCTTCSGSKCKPGTAPSRCTACGGRGSVNYRQGPMTIQMQCTKCAGKGTSIKYPCTNCRGSGTAKVKIEEEIQVPKGINNGQNLRMPKKGNESDNGGAAGDLIVKVNVKPDAFFQRDGYDIVTTQFVTLSEAVLGTKLKVKTLNGEKEVEVKSGTQHGEKVKIKGQGISNLPPNQNQVGDHVITLKIHVPRTLTPQERELFEKLSEVETKVDPSMNFAFNSQQASSSGKTSSSSQSKQQQQQQQQQQQGQKQSQEDVYNKFKKMWGV